MNRREVLSFVKFGIIYGMARPSFAAPTDAGHGSLIKNAKLFDAAFSCSKAAEACITHCVEELAQGDDSLTECARNSREVLVICNALHALAAQNSPHLCQYTRLSAEICRACETECRRHRNHATCRNCADACALCAAECGKLAWS